MASLVPMYGSDADVSMENDDDPLLLYGSSTAGAHFSDTPMDVVSDSDDDDPLDILAGPSAPSLDARTPATNPLLHETFSPPAPTSPLFTEHVFSINATTSASVASTSSSTASTSSSTARYQTWVCDLCGKPVRVDINSQYKWDSHRNSDECMKRVKRNERVQKQQDEAEAEERRHRSLSFDLQRSRSFSSSSIAGSASGAGYAYSRAPSALPRNDVPCPGVELTWPPGFSSNNYPFLIHEIAPAKYDFRPDNFVWTASGSSRLFLRSLACRRYLPSSDAVACVDCLSILSSDALRELKERAMAPPMPHAPTASLSHVQMQELVHHKDYLLRVERSKVQNLEHRLATSQGRVSTYKRIQDAIAEGDVKRVDAVLRVAIRQNASPEDILERLGKAARNEYSAKSFSSREKGFVLFMKRIGGGANGIYALQQMFGLPCATTVRGSRPPRLILSVSAITDAEIISNIQSFLGPRIPDTSEFKTGCSIMWDGFHVTPKARKVGNQAGGLCREHAPDHDLLLQDIPTVQKLARAVHLDKTCHYGTEATVFFFGPLRAERYHAIPFIVSPSCKTEKYPAHAQLLERILTLYEIYAKPYLGPLFMTSTDGDAVYRAAQHELLMCQTPEIGSPLHTLLSPLPGFNMRCGKNLVVLGPDPKHIIKRAANLARSADGMLVLQIPVTRLFLKRWLLKLDWHDQVSVENLTDPADHQNVPKAVKLLRTIRMIPDHIIHSPDMTPDEAAEHRALSLIGHLWSNLYEAFTLPHLSLTEQLEKLSIFSHICIALYRQHTGSLMSTQLYYDSQSLVKGCFFYSARQKLLDPNQPVYLFLVGSDRGERRFCSVRTATHDTNPDALGLADGLSEDSDMDRIIEENPDLNKEHRRTSWTSSPNIDHVNPKFYTGNLRAGDADIDRAWNSGRRLAIAILLLFGVNIDFRDLFSRGVDMQRPMGDGKYPGVSVDDPVDRSIINNGAAPVPFTIRELLDIVEEPARGSTECTPAPPVPAPTSDTLPPSPTSSSLTVPSDVLLASPYAVSDGEDSDDSDSDEDARVDEPHNQTALLPPSDDDEDLERLDKIASSIELQDLLCDPDDHNVLKTSVQNENDWFLVPNPAGGPARYIHKASVIRLLFSEEGCRLSPDRILRVRGYRRDGPRRSNEEGELIAGDIFTVGQLALVAIKSESIISLALMKVVQIDSENRKRIEDISPSELGSPTSPFTIAGYIYDLVPAILPTVAQDMIVPSPTLMEPSSSAGSEPQTPPERVWASPANFISFVAAPKVAKTARKKPAKQSSKQKTVSATEGTKTSFTVRVPGALVVPLPNPSKISIQAVPEDKRERLTMLGSSTTYSVKDSDMLSVLERFNAAYKNHPILKKLKNLKRSELFPYRSNNEVPFVLCDTSITERTGTQNATSSSSDDVRDKKHCRLCNASMTAVEGNARGHASRHIGLALHCSVFEDSLIDEMHDIAPCGYCGGDCPVELEKTKTSFKVISSCFWMHAFQYNSAKSSTTTANPSTNVPIICSLCTPDTPKNGKRYPAVWKYNFPRHIERCHPTLWDATVKDIIRKPEHRQLWDDMAVSQKEKDALLLWNSNRIQKRPEKRPTEDTGISNKRARTASNP